MTPRTSNERPSAKLLARAMRSPQSHAFSACENFREGDAEKAWLRGSPTQDYTCCVSDFHVYIDCACTSALVLTEGLHVEVSG